MSIDRFLTSEITIVTPGTTVDRYNNLALDWSKATSTCAVGWLTQVTSSEQIGLRDATLSGWKLYLPACTPVAVTDRIVADGKTFEVDGEPHSAHTPDGEHHIEIALRRVVDEWQFA